MDVLEVVSRQDAHDVYFIIFNLLGFKNGEAAAPCLAPWGRHCLLVGEVVADVNLAVEAIAHMVFDADVLDDEGRVEMRSTHIGSCARGWE